MRDRKSHLTGLRDIHTQLPHATTTQELPGDAKAGPRQGAKRRDLTTQERTLQRRGVSSTPRSKGGTFV
ncbi:unnamed protein product [Boreogadus saida]